METTLVIHHLFLKKASSNRSALLIESRLGCISVQPLHLLPSSFMIDNVPLVKLHLKGINYNSLSHNYYLTSVLSLYFIVRDATKSKWADHSMYYVNEGYWCIQICLKNDYVDISTKNSRRRHLVETLAKFILTSFQNSFPTNHTIICYTYYMHVSYCRDISGSCYYP